jgi:hypothetical protein
MPNAKPISTQNHVDLAVEDTLGHQALALNGQGGNNVGSTNPSWKNVGASCLIALVSSFNP